MFFEVLLLSCSTAYSVINSKSNTVPELVELVLELVIHRRSEDIFVVLILCLLQASRQTFNLLLINFKQT